MNPARWRKALYLPLMAAVVVGSVLLMMRGSAVAIAVVIALLFIPGRVQGIYYRDFFRGRRLFAAGQAAEAIPFFTRFLESLRARPWIKRLVWLQYAAYSTDIEAMTLNNLGAAHVELGEMETGTRYLEEALRVDPRYAVPVHNLALIAAMRGDSASAEQLLSEAARLGYTGGTLDTMMMRAGELLARLEGRSAPVRG